MWKENLIGLINVQKEKHLELKTKFKQTQRYKLICRKENWPPHPYPLQEQNKKKRNYSVKFHSKVLNTKEKWTWAWWVADGKTA